jgi:hypothetical protein
VCIKRAGRRFPKVKKAQVPESPAPINREFDGAVIAAQAKPVANIGELTYRSHWTASIRVVY